MTVFVDLTPFVSERYAPYARAASHALKTFLDQLPAHRLEEMALTGTTGTLPVPVLLLQILRACPTLHKLGQVLARDEQLHQSLREQLELLERLPTPPPSNQEQEQLATLLSQGSTPTQASWQFQPLAQASVARVLRARCEGKPELALKVLLPGVEQKVEEEFAALPAAVAAFDDSCRSEGIKTPDLPDVLERVTQLLRLELDLTNEQRHLKDAAQLYEHDVRVRVPEVLDASTHSLTVMTFLAGDKISETPRALRKLAAERAFEALIARPLLLTSRSSAKRLLHGDPHAGNLLHDDQLGLGILDWSLAYELESAEIDGLVQTVVALRRRSSQKLQQAITALSPSADAELVSSICGNALAIDEKERGAKLGFSSALGLLDTLAMERAFRLSEGMLLLPQGPALA